MKQVSYLGRQIQIVDSVQQWKKQHDLFMSGQFYEDAFLRYTASLNLPGQYLDIGANIGNHSLFWALFSKADKIHSFECMPRFMKVYYEMMIANQVMDRVELHPHALSDGEGYQDITFFSTTEPTYARRLDDVEINGRVSLIKIDVEGMEPAVLRGGIERISQDKPIIFAEAHSKALLAEIMEILRPAGYSVGTKVFNETPTYEIVAG